MLRSKFYSVGFAGIVLALSLALRVDGSDPEYQAGTVSFGTGKKGIIVGLPRPMPDSDYAVFVQPTNTAGYSSSSECTYFNVLKKQPTQFQVQHKTCDKGTPMALDTNVSLDWIVVARGTSFLLREVCYDGGILRYKGVPVGCIYTAEVAQGREDELCGGTGNSAFKSVNFGLTLPPNLPNLPGGPRVFGCFVCIGGKPPEVINAVRATTYPEGFTPGIGCLGYYRYELVDVDFIDFTQ
jgi:hypothetical protein